MILPSDKNSFKISQNILTEKHSGELHKAGWLHLTKGGIVLFSISSHLTSFLDLFRKSEAANNDNETMINEADIGLEKKIKKLPSDKTRDLLNSSSNIGPRTKARTNGAGS